MKEKYKVVDTNVFLVDAIAAIYGFQPKAGYKNNLVIPGVVLSEMERFKKEMYTPEGYNARVFSKELKKIINEGQKAGFKSINEGIKICDNYFIHILLDSNPVSFSSDGFNNDDYIIGTARKLANNDSSLDVELVTNDNLMYIKASSIGLKVSDWEGARAVSDIRDIYEGWRSVRVDKNIIRNMGTGYLDVKKSRVDGMANLMPNEYILLIDKNLPSDYEVPDFNEACVNSTDFALARYVKNVPGLDEGGLIEVKTRCSRQSNVVNITARNYEQAFALDALTNPDIKLVNLVGPAGTGKTLLAIAGGLDGLNFNNSLKSNSRSKSKSKSHSGNTFKNKHGLYDKLLITRIMTSSAEEHHLGALPGEISDKMHPYLMPIYDNFKPQMFDALVNRVTNEPEDRANMRKTTDTMMFRDILINNGKLEIQPASTIRGRSIDNAYFIIDESQNMSPSEIKTMVTRAGENTKIVLTGDPAQNDRPGLTELINGLVHSSERFKDQEISATVYLNKGERSLLATLGSKLL